MSSSATVQTPPRKLTSVDKVLNALGSEPKTHTQLHEELRGSKHTSFYAQLKQLQEAGKIKKVQQTKGVAWIRVPEESEASSEEGKEAPIQVGEVGDLLPFEEGNN